ncbi:hypothetical protein [Spiroplasma endosymbiont of Acasis viretata]|uniref:hypothetical protein n=1 Tax=Spiroplasma endosymbiont of Acasis viretata TaxID=3066306 RepID=UPI00313AE3D0
MEIIIHNDKLIKIASDDLQKNIILLAQYKLEIDKYQEDLIQNIIFLTMLLEKYKNYKIESEEIVPFHVYNTTGRRFLRNFSNYISNIQTIKKMTVFVALTIVNFTIGALFPPLFLPMIILGSIFYFSYSIILYKPVFQYLKFKYLNFKNRKKNNELNKRNKNWKNNYLQNIMKKNKYNINEYKNWESKYFKALNERINNNFKNKNLDIDEINSIDSKNKESRNKDNNHSTSKSLKI